MKDVRAESSVFEEPGAAQAGMTADENEILTAPHDSAEAVAAHARAAWPAISLRDETFVAHLAALGWREAMPPFARQVYLTCACGTGQEAAYRIFDRAYTTVIKRAIQNVCRAAHRIDEIQQAVREKLFVGPTPGVAKYSGRAPLEAWLRLLVKRVALDAERAARRRSRRDAVVTHPCGVVSGAFEGELDRRRYAALLQAALTRAFSGLPARDFDVLRLHYASGVGIDALGRVFGVHRATAARWLEKIQSQLRAGVRQSLRESSRALSDDELSEILVLAEYREELCSACWSSVVAPQAEP